MLQPCAWLRNEKSWLLCESDASINLVDDQGCISFKVAAKDSGVALSQVLVDWNANVNLAYSSENGANGAVWTLCMRATQNGCVKSHPRMRYNTER